MNEGVALVVDVDRARLDRRRDLRYLDRVVDSREEALREVARAKAARRSDFDRLRRQRSRRVSGALRAWLPAGRRHRPNLGARSAQRLRSGGPLARAKRRRCARAIPKEYERRALESCRTHVEAMVRFLDAGAVVFDYGNNIRAQAERAGFARAFAFPGFVPAFIRPLFCRGSGPFRFAALSGDADDIARCDEKLLELFPRKRVAGTLDPARARTHLVPRAAGADLLAGIRRSRESRLGASTNWCAAVR